MSRLHIVVAVKALGPRRRGVVIRASFAYYFNSKLKASERVSIARDPRRPKTMDYIENMFTDFIEMKGDRLFGEDESIVGGIGRFHGLPGLGIRIIGEVTAEKVKIVQDADAIYREEIAKAGLDKGLGQYFAALTNMRSVGVMGDFRTYDYAIALRAVNTSDFMTADAAQIPWEVLNTVTNRIVNEVKGVNRVMYDCTSKPPGTIEFE